MLVKQNIYQFDYYLGKKKNPEEKIGGSVVPALHTMNYCQQKHVER